MVFIENPPLIYFTLQVGFKAISNITLNDLHQIGEKLKNDYPKKIKLSLFPSQMPGNLNLQFIPLQFSDEKNKYFVELYSDSIKFIYNEYSHWGEIRPGIIKTLKIMTEILKVSQISNLRMEYIDQFYFDKHMFDLREFFNLHICFPENWTLNFEDFHLGINLNSSSPNLSVLRLRGIKSTDTEKFLFRLEFITSRDINILINDDDRIIDTLNDIHQTSINYFTQSLTDKLKSKIGLNYE